MAAAKPFGCPSEAEKFGCRNRHSVEFTSLKQNLPLAFYPRPPRGGRLPGHPQAVITDGISIHALREEGDRLSDAQLARLYKFLSTPSARRATTAGEAGTSCRTNFYPRPPRGGRRSVVEVVFDLIRFLSTPSARRATIVHLLTTRLLYRFLSTPSARRATTTCAEPQKHYEISIHALREEGDRKAYDGCDISTNFYPRPPRGGRRKYPRWVKVKLRISIHALREEGDNPPMNCSATLSHFYPRPPRGGRHFT